MKSVRNVITNYDFTADPTVLLTRDTNVDPHYYYHHEEATCRLVWRGHTPSGKTEGSGDIAIPNQFFRNAHTSLTTIMRLLQ